MPHSEEILGRTMNSQSNVLNVTLSASPSTSRASAAGYFTVSGGTVTLIEYIRNGTAVSLGSVLAGILPISQGDDLRVTYAVAPTVKFIRA